MKVGSYEKLDDALYIWFRQQREKMSHLLVLNWWKMWKYCSRCYVYPESEKVFTGSTRFEWRFCKWHGIRNLSLQGEKASADADATEEFKGDFSSLTSSYSHYQIFWLWWNRFILPPPSPEHIGRFIWEKSRW